MIKYEAACITCTDKIKDKGFTETIVWAQQHRDKHNHKVLFKREDTVVLNPKVKCDSCKKILKDKSEFVRGKWHMYEQDGSFVLSDNGDTYYCISCFCYQENFGAYFDKTSLKHSEDCPLVKLRITCDECGYRLNESRYIDETVLLKPKPNQRRKNGRQV